MSSPSKQKSNPKPDTRPDRNEIRRHLKYLVYPDSCFEIRLIEARVDYNTRAIVPASNQSATISGYYRDPEFAIPDLAKVENVSVYVVENPIRESLHHRKNKNKLCPVGNDETTKDKHIDWLVRILIDMDSDRDSGISATNDELRPVLERQDYLLGNEPIIRAASIWGCSGNGGWITAECIPISCINPDPDDDTWVHPSWMVKHFLTSLSLRYSTKQVEIDCKVFNPSRIGPLAGTYKCKGTHDETRPHRMVSLDSPDRPVVPFSLADYCAANPIEEAASTGNRKGKKGRIVVPATLVDVNGAPLSPPVPPSEADDMPDSVRNLIDGATEERAVDLRRAWECVKKIPFAISGQSVSDDPDKHGHAQTFDVACVLIRGFGLSRSEATTIFDWYCNHCVPTWDGPARSHKLDDAEKEKDRDEHGRVKEHGYKLFERNGLPDRDQFLNNGFVDGDVCGTEPKAESRPLLPSILWNPIEMHANNKVVAYLNKFDGLYQKDNMLVEIVHGDSSHESIRFLEVSNGTPVIAATSVHRLREIISSIVMFKQKIGKHVIPQLVYTPEKCVAAIHARHSWPGVPRLVGVVEHPILRPDGSISEKTGYDRDTGMLWIGNSTPAIPDLPGEAEAKASASAILDLVSQFEFEDDISRVAWLACLLTIVGRHLINGNVPLFYFDASTAGSGKSLLCDVISCIVTGRQMTRTAYHHDTVEMDKRLVSILMAGLRVTMLDNIEGDFGNSALDNALTARYYQGRILGVSKMWTGPVDTTFVATANNAVFCGDLFRRAITIRLVSSYERPDHDQVDFKIKDLEKYTIQNRETYLGHALTILRAYLLAKVDHGLPTNVYADWTNLIRGSVQWATGFDPWKHRSKSVKSDPKRIANSAFLDGFWRMLTVLKRRTMTTNDILENLDGITNQSVHKEMFDAVTNMFNCRKDQLPSAIAFGKRLSSMKSTRFGKYRLIKEEDTSAHLASWSVQERVGTDWISPSVPRSAGTSEEFQENPSEDGQSGDPEIAEIPQRLDELRSKDGQCYWEDNNPPF